MIIIKNLREDGIEYANQGEMEQRLLKYLPSILLESMGIIADVDMK